MGDNLLAFAGVLVRRDDADILVLARPGDGGLTLEVEMILAAEGYGTREPVRGRVNRRPRIAPGHPVGILHVGFRRHGLGDGQDWCLVLIVDERALRGGARLGQGLGRDDEHCLARIMDLAARGLRDRQHRLVMDHRACIVPARNVGGREHRDHARGGAHGRQVHPGHPRPGLWR